MKLKIFLIASFLSFITTTNGQTKNQIQFIGFSMREYQRPILVSGDKYKPHFENMGESMEQGRIIINEDAKTFAIKWLNGEEWECKYSKKETKTEHVDLYGDVEKTTYLGKWKDDNIDCMLIIAKTKTSGCLTTLNSKKVVDADYGIDTWKKVFTFGTSGKCFESL